jgi:hypothetical protein
MLSPRVSSPDESSRWPDLIYANGPSSSGKTTLCLDDFVFESAPRYYLGADTAHHRSSAGSSRRCPRPSARWWTAAMP